MDNTDEIGAKSAQWIQLTADLRDPEQILAAIKADKQSPRTAVATPLDELEQTLRQHPAVRDVAVVVQQSAGERQVIAYVIADVKRSPVISGRPRYTLPNNMAIVHLNAYETENTYHEIFEEQIYLRHGITVHEGDCVVDVGANIGLFTLYIHHHCAGVRVYAFEPAPDAFAALCLNVQLFGVNATSFNVGIAGESRQAPFYYFPRASTMSGYYADISQDVQDVKSITLKRDLHHGDTPRAHTQITDQRDKLIEEGIGVPQVISSQVRTLSEVIAEQNIEHIDLLKVDAEKSELEVLSGLQDHDWHKVRQLVIEVHPAAGQPLLAVKALLEARGYAVTVDQEAERLGSDVYMVYACPQEQRAVDSAKLVTHAVPITIDPLVTSDELHSFLATHLPHLGSQPTIRFVDRIPVMDNGTVDLPSHPSLGTAMCGMPRAFQAARSPTEQWLVDALSDVLRIDQIGVFDDFFELGGDSLRAIEILSRVREIFQVEVPLDVLFTMDFTAATLAQLVEQRLIEQADPELVKALLAEIDQMSDANVRAQLDLP